MVVWKKGGYKMKVIWRYLVLFLLYIGVLNITGCGQEIETYDVPPAIMFQNSVYSTNRNPNETASFYENDLVNWGEVKSSTVDGSLPKENFQSNWEEYIGCEIYTSKDFPNHIFVLSMDSEGVRHYSIFEKSE